MRFGRTRHNSTIVTPPVVPLAPENGCCFWTDQLLLKPFFQPKRQLLFNHLINSSTHQYCCRLDPASTKRLIIFIPRKIPRENLRIFLDDRGGVYCSNFLPVRRKRICCCSNPSLPPSLPLVSSQTALASAPAPVPPCRLASKAYGYGLQIDHISIVLRSWAQVYY